jgi:NADH-quinone oxidoreductase subunit G
LKPRFNPFVNRWWLCDEGPLSYEFVNAGRIEYPYLRKAGQLDLSDWDTVIDEVSRALKTVVDSFGAPAIGVIASPQLSNEDLYLVQKFFRDMIGVSHIGFRNPWEQPGYEDDFLIRADKNPNSRGAEAMGLDSDVRRILEDAAAGRIKLLYVFNHEFKEPEAIELLKAAPLVVFQGTNWNQTTEMAHAVLPSATYAEKDGTFSNFEGRIQRFSRAVPPLEESKTDFEILNLLADKLDYPFLYNTPEDLYREWRGQTYDEMDGFGEPLQQPAEAGGGR